MSVLLSELRRIKDSLSDSELAGNWLQLPGFTETCDDEDSQLSCDESPFTSTDAVIRGEGKIRVFLTIV